MSEHEQKRLDGRRPCAHCGRPFLPLIRQAKYCMGVCRRKAGQEQARQKLQEKREEPT